MEEQDFEGMNILSRRLCFVLPVGSLGLLVLSAGIPVAQTAQTAAKLAGQASFRRQCAVCHGEKGEGTKRYQSPLIGSRTEPELAGYIAAKMPPGPASAHCSAGDAKSIALFIYDAFYSPVAQARNRAPSIALSRLTVKQYRNAVSDLLSSFRSPVAVGPDRGLQSEYYKVGRPDGGQRALTRVDPQVHFNYATAVPIAQDPDPYQFSMVWRGSVYAPETGDYDFIVKTEHAAQFYINDDQKPLIDALVKSGDRTEYRGSLYLVAGHYYPLRLEFYKGVTGVDNLEKVKKKPPLPASISLEWKRPKQAEEVVPERCLAPITVQASYVASTPFPPDDRSIGYERGTSVSKAWQEAAVTSALDTSEFVKTHLRDLSGVADDAKDRTTRLHDFCVQFVTRAFRRPLDADLQARYVDRQFLPDQDPGVSVKRVVLLALSSPRFLYLDSGAANPDSFATASRLSFALWDSAPDAELMRAATQGELSTREQVGKQADRMLSDVRAWAKLRDFFMLWLRVDQYPDLAKDAKQYPEFDPVVATDLRTSLELELREIALGDHSDYRDLFLSDRLFLNGKLAKIYGGGGDQPSDGVFREVKMKPGERYGVLTHPYLMSSLAYLKASSPIHRGVLIYRNMLGRILQPPPAAFAPLAADLHPDLTTRERVEMQTKPAFCHGCHSMVNPIGYTLERYDAIGRLRDTDNGKPVDTSGEYRKVSGETVHFGGVGDLAKYIADSPEAHSAFVEKLFQNLVKQPIRAYGDRQLPELQSYFEQNQCSIRKLVLEIATRTSIKR